MIKKVVKVLWIFIALITLTCVVIFFSIAKGWIGYMPPVEDLENPNYKFATEIFSEDGKVLGTYSYSKENRVFVGYNDLSPHIINALIATEDVRFAEHSGIDAIALFRAVVKRGILMQKNAGGGSTISQQLSKQLYSPSADNIVERLFQKPIEWVIAVKLERYYTKEEILTMYLNKFDFLNNAVGIKTAAYTYFGFHLLFISPMNMLFRGVVPPLHNLENWGKWTHFIKKGIKKSALAKKASADCYSL
mgnify:CR=1 FL=1